jgi:hypothetical protein
MDTFVRDRTAGTTTRVSTNAFGGQIAKGGDLVAFSYDGDTVAFGAVDPDVTSPSSNGTTYHAYLRSGAGTITVADVRDANGAYANGGVLGGAISGTGRYVAFTSSASDIVRNDTNTASDVFVRDRQATSAPFTTWALLADQQYIDFAGHSGTSGQVADWAARLANGETNVGRMIAAHAHGPAWSGKRGPVLRLYWAFFLRAPDAGGLAYWLGKSEGGMPLATIAQKFALSSEFQNTYGPLADADFVKLVYGNVLQRKSDAAGVSFWVDQLQHHGLTRGGMMPKFSESSEGKRVLSPYVDVLLLHLGLLRQLPTKVEFSSETQAVITGNTPIEDLADQLRLWGSYSARFAN